MKMTIEVTGSPDSGYFDLFVDDLLVDIDLTPLAVRQAVIDHIDYEMRL